jgi:hypothetical protein
VAAVVYPAVGANLRGKNDESLVQVAEEAPTIAAELKQAGTVGQLVPFGNTQLQILPGATTGPRTGSSTSPITTSKWRPGRTSRISTTRPMKASPGSGLGLAIVRRIAGMHDGTVEAIPLQQGMKFRISVPEIAVDPPTAERTPGTQLTLPFPLPRPVDDDLDHADSRASLAGRCNTEPLL